MLNAKSVEDLLSNQFAIDFIQGTLRQTSRSASFSYSGPGSITQDSAGKLCLKLYHSFESDSEAHAERSADDARSRLPAGQIVDESHYFQFEAMEESGRTWTCNRVWLNPKFCLPGPGRVIEAELKSIATELAQPVDYAPLPRFSSVIIVGKYAIPTKAVDWDHLGQTIARSEFEVENMCKCVLRQHANSLEVRLSDFFEGVGEGAERAVLEAIGVSIGADLSPIYEYRHQGSIRSCIVRSRSSGGDRARLLPPVPCTWPDDEENIHRFVNAMIGKYPASRSEVASSCRRVIDGFAATIFENRALVLTVAVEGLVDSFFADKRDPDASYVEDLEKAREPVSLLPIPYRSKRTLLTALDNGNRRSVKSALYRLADEGRLPKVLVDAWSKLRNTAAHAKPVEISDGALQTAVNRLNSTLELFYRLIVIHLGYDGPIKSYSKLDFPSLPSQS